MSDFVRIPVGRGTPEGVNSAYVVPDRGIVIDPVIAALVVCPPVIDPIKRLETTADWATPDLILLETRNANRMM